MIYLIRFKVMTSQILFLPFIWVNRFKVMTSLIWFPPMICVNRKVMTSLIWFPSIICVIILKVMTSLIRFYFVFSLKGWILLRTTQFWKPIGSSKLIMHPRWDFFAPVNSIARGVPPPPSTGRLQLLCQCFIQAMRGSTQQLSNRFPPMICVIRLKVMTSLIAK